MNDFKVGDTVQVKGIECPYMSISGFILKPEKEVRVKCIWFNKEKMNFEENEFYCDMLKHIEED